MVVPTVFVELKLVAATVSPSQTTTETGWFTCAEGLTVIVKFSVEPTQLTPPLENVGVTVRFAVIGAFPVLTTENAGIDPTPDAGIPILGVLLVHA